MTYTLYIFYKFNYYTDQLQSTLVTIVVDIVISLSTVCRRHVIIVY